VFGYPDETLAPVLEIVLIALSNAFSDDRRSVYSFPKLDMGF